MLVGFLVGDSNATTKMCIHEVDKKMLQSVNRQKLYGQTVFINHILGGYFCFCRFKHGMILCCASAPFFPALLCSRGGLENELAKYFKPIAMRLGEKRGTTQMSAQQQQTVSLV